MFIKNKRLKIMFIVLGVVIVLTPVNISKAASNKSEIVLKVGATKKIGNKKTKWKSEKAGVAVVKNGEIRALNTGTTVLTAKEGNKTLKYSVKVIQSENKKYKKKSYYVSKSFEPGYYMLFNTSDTEEASYSIYKGREFDIYKTSMSNNFKYNQIVEVKKGETIYMENCYASKLSESIVRTKGEGVFIVGTHLKAGKYKIRSIDGSVLQLYTITDSWNSPDFIEAMGLSDRAEVTVTLKNGQYINLVGCKIDNIK